MSRGGRRPASLHLGLAVVALLGLPMARAAPADSSPAFDSGLAEFQAGRFDAALAAFRDAERSGMASRQLHYNLAVTYFKLANYEQAREQFTVLAEIPEVAGLAHYNLGLIALEQGQPLVARREFDQALRMATDPRVAAIAEDRLAELERPEDGAGGRSAKTGFAFADFAAGYDDNVTFSSSGSSLPPSQRHSPATSILAGGGTALTGTVGDGLLASASLFRVDYFNVSDYTANDARLALSYRLHRGDWGALAGAQAGYATLGGKAFETQGGVRAELSRRLGRFDTAALGYRYDHVAGGSQYRYLDGSRQQLTIDNTAALGALTLQLGYRLELNSRRDLTAYPEFFSESPRRQRVFGIAKIRLAQGLELRAAARYQQSRYGQADVFVSNGVLVSATRTDRLYNLGAELRVALGEQFSLSGSYELEHNGSNIGRYGYLSRRYFATLHWDP